MMKIYGAALILVFTILHGCSTAEDQGEKRTMNHLKNEKSPYLLQHVYNPVDWYPWGDEAFEKAKKENKPVFLSIGYSTCHWCHVMEHESFEDEEVAALLNKYFVCIKVDREERPDIDSVYMDMAQYLGGGGGWPLTVVMRPDKKPFFAGTYIPKQTKYRQEGLMTLLPKIAAQYAGNTSEVTEAIKRVERRIALQNQPPRPFEGEVAPDVVFEQMLYGFDPVFGGFGRGMKFPTSHQLLYLMEYHRRTGNPDALKAVEITLKNIRNGGIYDHVGFGVHRYAVDPFWFVPHFEKMLYNQAQLSMASLEFYQATGAPFARQMTEEIYEYVLRDLRSPQGGFYSAEDADSEGEEGAFYVWKYDELQKLLTAEELALVEKVFDVKKEGNWHDRVHDKTQPTNIFHITSVGEKALVALDDAGRKRLESAREKLFKARVKRIRPSLDNKILTDWNGLMIASLARGGRVLDNEKYTRAAKEAYAFIKKNMYTDGHLLHRWADGEAAIPGMLADHTNLAWGALELYRTTSDVAYLEDATGLMETVIKKFKDKSSGFNMTSGNEEDLPMTPAVFSDMAVPSGNSVAYYVFSELFHFTGNTDFQREADGLAKVYAPGLLRYPQGRTFAALAMDRQHRKSYEVILVDNGDAKATQRLREELEVFLSPENNTYFITKTKENAATLDRLAPFTTGQVIIDGKPTAYVCSGTMCLPPVTSVDQLKDKIPKPLAVPQ